MTLAYVFCEHAEAIQDYGTPLKRMMKLLQVFDQELRDAYDKNNNTQAADIFRSTLMITALMYAFFDTEYTLRDELVGLHFLFSDYWYGRIMGKLQ
jgi:hypothetical protein